MKKIILGIDLDGTVAKWRKGAYPEELLEKGYFRTLTPEEGLIRNIKQANDEGIIIPIVISAYMTESRYAEKEKKDWVRENLPFVEHVILTPCGKNKIEYARPSLNGLINSNFVMLEDYTPALNDVVATGGKAIKFMNGINGTNGTWQGYKLYKDAVDRYDWFLTVFLKQIMKNKI